MSAPSPTARGQTGKTSVTELLIHAALRSLEGTAVFEHAERGKWGVTFAKGLTCKIQSPLAEQRLGQVLLRLATVPKEELQQCLADPTKKPLGQKLIDRGQLTHEQLRSALKVQFEEKLTSLATLPPETVFAVYEGHDLLSRWPAANPSSDPLPSIWITAQTLGEERCREPLAEYGEELLGLHPQAKPERFGFGPGLAPLLSALRGGRQSLRELLDGTSVDPTRAVQALFILASCRHLVSASHTAWPLGVAHVSRAPNPVSGRPVRVSIQPVVEALDSLKPSASPSDQDPSMPPSGGTARQAFAKRIESMTHYEVLQVSKTASNSDVAAAFLRLAKTWHPDKISSADPADRDAATRVFARLNEAHRTLVNETARREYDEQLEAQTLEDDGEQEMVMNVLNAASAFQKALVLVRKREFDHARQLAQEATESDPEQAEYAALLAWIDAHLPPYRDGGDYTKLLRELTDAVKRQPRNVRIHQYRADVLNRAGEAEEALREYEWVAQREPNNVDVAREIRLYQMRQQKSPESQGLWSRWLKR